MIALVFHILSLLPLAATCLDNSGKTACGYGCLAAHGEVACARTSAGVCGATDHELVCWDPPDSVRGHYGDKAPRPQCLTRMGSIACGYNCVARDPDEVQCSSTPDGVCVTTSRGLTCWDPPPSSYCLDDKALPRARCITVDGNAACGYGCVALNGELACASTPGGKCDLVRNQFVCFDPEGPAMCGGQPCRADDPVTGRAWCRPRPPAR